MAVGREALRIAVHDRQISSRFICVIDLDDVLLDPPSSTSIRLAMSRLQSEDSLFAVAATSRPVFYDLLALRTEGHDYSNLERDLADTKGSPLAYLRLRETRIIPNQRKMTKSSPILCKSSFNGVCIYKAEDYLIGTYRAPDESEVSEHVNLNLSIGRATGKQMMIIPELIVQAPIEHTATNRLQVVLRAVYKRLHSRWA